MNKIKVFLFLLFVTFFVSGCAKNKIEEIPPPPSIKKVYFKKLPPSKEEVKIRFITDELNVFANRVYEKNNYNCSDYSIVNKGIWSGYILFIDNKKPVVEYTAIANKKSVSEIMVNGEIIKQEISRWLSYCNEITKKLHFTEKGVY